MPLHRQRRSFGSIDAVIEGKKYVCRWYENTDNGRTRKSKTVTGSYREAERFLAVKQVELGDQRSIPTISEIYELWYKPWAERQVADGKKKQGTVDRYTEVWENVISPKWGDVPLDRVRPDRFQAWLLDLNAGNANISLVILRKFADLAMLYNRIDNNVFRRNYDKPIATSRQKVAGVYNLDKAREVYQKLRECHSIAFAPYILACFGGTRVGESLGVMCHEVTTIECAGVRFAVVPIRRRMVKTGCSPLPDGDLKTPQSVRETLIPEPYCYDLLKLVEAREGAWLADRGDGLPLNENSFMYFFNRDIGRDAIPLSNLRASWRTFASFRWHVPSDTLELLMGHKLDGISGRHYIRPSIGELARSFAERYKVDKDI